LPPFGAPSSSHTHPPISAKPNTIITLANHPLSATRSRTLYRSERHHHAESSSSIAAERWSKNPAANNGHIQPAQDDPWIAGKHTYWESNGQVTRRVRVA